MSAPLAAFLERHRRLVVLTGAGCSTGSGIPAWHALARADALLVVGSSLMVFSGFRFVLEAERLRLPVAAVNLGRTRADDRLHLKVDADCGEALAEAVAAAGC